MSLPGCLTPRPPDFVSRLPTENPPSGGKQELLLATPEETGFDKKRMFEITQIILIGKEWFSKLPPDARILKENLSQKNKYKVNCRIS